MTTPESVGLAARLAELEAENARLKTALGAPVPAGPPRHVRSRGWSVLSAVLIVLGLALGSISVVTSYAKNQLTDTEMFVSTFAPLADDPEVQGVVTDAVTGAITDAVDLPGLTATVFDGLSGLDLPPRAASALGLLQAPIAQGLQSLVRGTVEDFIASPAFSDIWAATLRTTHTQVLATMQNDPGAALTIAAGGSLELQLGPIIAEVRSRLLANGVTFAQAIPAIDRSIVIVQDASLGSLTAIYAVIVAVGSWLPWVALALLTAGVFAARHRRRALVATAIAAGVLMGVLGLAIAIGRTIAAAAIAGGAVTAGAAEVIYDAVTAAAANTVLAIAVLAIAVAVTAWASGPARPARWLRETSGTVAAAARSAGDRRGITTGAIGRWIDRNHVLVLAAIATISAAVVLFTRPLSGSTIIATFVVAVLAVVVVQLVRRPDRDSVPGTEPADRAPGTAA
ncbi:MAG: hypothetical protein P0Y60_16155 [Candidatus Microbacterium colombiense]|nr:MAG: hypothetical protein P0Y60_16155 [Microbacterium sp.]